MRSPAVLGLCSALVLAAPALAKKTPAVAPKLKVMTRENMLVMPEASGKTLAECEGECEVDDLFARQ